MRGLVIFPPFTHRSIDGFKLDRRKTDALRRYGRAFHKFLNDFFSFLRTSEQIFVSAAVNNDVNAIREVSANRFAETSR